MNGSVVTLLVEAGTAVKKGDSLIVIEAMKMEHTLSAPADGTVAEFFFAAGDLVSQGAELLKFEANEDNKNDLIYEVADLWFHTIVMLGYFDLDPQLVLNELARRQGLSGLVEKANRQH